MFELTDKNSYEHLQLWHDWVHKQYPACKFVVLGTKADLALPDPFEMTFHKDKVWFSFHPDFKLKRIAYHRSFLIT